MIKLTQFNYGFDYKKTFPEIAQEKLHDLSITLDSNGVFLHTFCYDNNHGDLQVERTYKIYAQDKPISPNLFLAQMQDNIPALKLLAVKTLKMTIMARSIASLQIEAELELPEGGEFIALKNPLKLRKIDESSGTL